MDMDYESRGYLLDDFRLFHLRSSHGTKVESHYHEFCKVLLLLSGSGEYMVEGRRYHLQPGDIVLIGHHRVHRPDFAPGTAYERIILYISPEYLGRHSTGTCCLEDCFSGERGHVLRPGELRRRRIQGLAQELERELGEKAYGGDIVSNALLLQLLVSLSRELQQGGELPRPLVSENKRILDIQRYLDSHLSEDVTIDALAQRFYISKYHMMRQFRQETGQSIHGYLLERRLLHARGLIAGGLSATESCFRSGFGSYASFTRAYGRRFGITPTGRPVRMEETYE